MEIAKATPKIAVTFQVSLPHDLCASLALSETAGQFDGLSDWLKSIPASPARREFVSLSRYCPGLWGTLTNFPPGHPALADFDAFRVSLEARPADEFVAIAKASLCERLARWNVTAADSLVEQFAAAQATRRARLGNPASPDLPPEALAPLIGPDLKDRLIHLFSWFWLDHYESRWQEDLPRMAASVRFHNGQSYPADFKSLFIAATGRAMPDSIRDSLPGVVRATFVPSCHIGPYFIFTTALPIIAISFNALTVDPTAHSRPEVVGLFPPLKALADETRLQIMALLSDGRERYAQEIMAELGLSQSATSRHLTLLESSGLLAARKEGTAKFYSLNANRSRTLLDSLKRLLRS
jgi:DNA-binding transcriptional ArsR family regulator